jgi:hypothetical protein
VRDGFPDADHAAHTLAVTGGYRRADCDRYGHPNSVPKPVTLAVHSRLIEAPRVHSEASGCIHK